MQTYRNGPTTERLTLRAMTADDAEAFYQLNSDPQVMRYTGEPPLQSVQEAAGAIASYPDFERYGFGRWGCVLKAEQRLIGFCGLKSLPELDAVDVGYRLLPEYWGRGLATEACQASVDFGFRVLGLEEIIALVMPGNAASIRVLEKVGLQFVSEVKYFGETALKYTVRNADLRSLLGS